MSSRDNEHKKSRMGRPPVDSEMLRARVERNMINALDAFAGSADAPVSRPEAIRAILFDWLATHGFLERSDGPKPSGPATDAIDAMETAIKAHKAKRR